MANSLSNLVNSLTAGIDKIKCKHEHNNKNCEWCWIKYKDCNCFLEYTNFKDNLAYVVASIIKTFDEILKKGFLNTFKFPIYDINRFILLLRKGVYSYEYMDDWEIFNAFLLPEKEDFYSHLNIEDITDPDYAQAKRICKDFKIRILRYYHDLYAQSDTFLLADVFTNIRNMCLKTNELHPASFLSALGLALKKTRQSKVRPFNWYWYGINGRKDIRGGICYTIYWYMKANSKYMKNYDKNHNMIIIMTRIIIS